uniref:RNA polymerase n=1 Tax=Xanthomonas phage MK21 TaxID=3148942 RepID=A0AAU7J823_9CAUD
MILNLRVNGGKLGSIRGYQVLVNGECYSVSYTVKQSMHPVHEEHTNKTAFLNLMEKIYEKLIKE